MLSISIIYELHPQSTSDLFKKDEIDLLRKFFSTNTIEKKDSNMPNYYYLAEEMKIVKRDIKDRITSYNVCYTKLLR